MASAGAVLILVQNLSAPFDQRVRREALALHAAGWRVAVLSPRGRRFDRRWHERAGGIEYYRYPAFEARAGIAAYLLEYAIALVCMTLGTAWIALRRGFDVIHLCNPPDLLFLAAAPYRLLGKRIVFDQHDLAPELFLAKRPAAARGPILPLLRLAEWLSYRIAGAVIVTNESYWSVARTRGGLPPARLFVVRNGPDADRVHNVPPDPALRRGKPHLIAYVGTMGAQDGVDGMLRILARLAHERGDFHAIVAGGGPELPALERMAHELGLDGVVEFAGRIPDADLMTLLSTADLCLAPDPFTALNDLSTMNKTLEYMALGRAQVAFDLHETRISAGGAALYAAPGDEAGFARQIARLLDDPALRHALGEEGRARIAQALAWEHSVPPLLAAYRFAMRPHHTHRMEEQAHV